MPLSTVLTCIRTIIDVSPVPYFPELKTFACWQYLVAPKRYPHFIYRLSFKKMKEALIVGYKKQSLRPFIIRLILFCLLDFDTSDLSLNSIQLSIWIRIKNRWISSKKFSTFLWNVKNVKNRSKFEHLWLCTDYWICRKPIYRNDIYYYYHFKFY